MKEDEILDKIEQEVKQETKKEVIIGNPNWRPGQSGNPAGRKKGSMNKYTKEIKEAFGLLLSSNTENFYTWIETIARQDPAKAMELLIKIAPYVVPKLAQNDITSEGKRIFFNLPGVDPVPEPEEETDEDE